MDRRTRVISGSRGCFRNIFLLVLFVQGLARVHGEEVLDPPTQVHLNGSQLIWTPGSEESGFTYTAECLRWGSKQWNVDPDCRRTSLTSCRPGSVRPLSQPTDDCIQLRVRAERAGLESEPVQACGSPGSPCSPRVQLTTGPGSVKVRLNRNHSLFLEHAGHAQYRVYFGAEGEEMEEHDSHASMMKQGLEAGRRYCVKVQFTLHNKSIGPASCLLCETVPQSSRPTQTVTVTVVVVVVVVVLLLVGFFYIVICKQKKIKEVLRPPIYIPEFFQEPFLDRDLPILKTPTEENFDVVCIFTPTESRGDRGEL